MTTQTLAGAGGRCTEGPGHYLKGGLQLQLKAYLNNVKQLPQENKPRRQPYAENPAHPSQPLPQRSRTRPDQAETTSALEFALEGYLVQITRIGTASEFSRTGGSEPELAAALNDSPAPGVTKNWCLMKP